MAESGALEYGTVLPSERELADELHLSRNTVKAAYRELRDQGWIETRRGVAPRLRFDARASFAQRLGTWQPTFVADARAELIDLAVGSLEAAPVVKQALMDPASIEPAIAVEGVGFSPDGEPELVDAVVDHLRDDGVSAAPDQIVITSGGQHALSLVIGAVAGQRRAVALESVVYAGMFDSLAHSRAPLVSLPMTADGLDAAESARLIRAASPAIVMVTNFHNPTGALLDADRARQILDAARDVGALIIDDRCPAHLPVGVADPAPALAALDPTAAVATIGSPSKVLWGGLRIGWIHTNATFAAHLRRKRMAIDFGGSPFLQRVTASLLRDHYRATARTVSAATRERAAAVVETVAAASLPWRVRMQDGGLSMWVETPGTDAVRLAERGMRAGVRVMPGAYFATRDGAGDGAVRLACVRPAAQMRQALDRLISVA